MSGPEEIFSDEWLRLARASNDEALGAAEAAKDSVYGQLYLSTLREWFEEFPLSAKDKSHLRARLESMKNEEHLSGVNELSWWKFMLREGCTAKPLLPAGTPTPDFFVETPSEFYAEVTTTNMSDDEKNKAESGALISLDHDASIRRFLGKVTAKKERQLKYAAGQRMAGVLVIFDYSHWSGFGTQLYIAIADALLKGNCAFAGLPPELSAIAYVERSVQEGNIGIKCSYSAMYYNPFALYSLAAGTFPSLNQFFLQSGSIETRPASGWVRL